MTPEQLAETLHEVLGTRLRSVILYGSAAAGDYVGKGSDYNVLVVTTTLGLAELQALAKPSVAWQRKGNPAPLFFTLERLQKSADVFPVELMDIQESHRILYGDNVLEEVRVHPENLRLILERELKTSLVQLREGFLLTEGKPKRVRTLMVDSLSTVLVLFRAALRLFQSEVPQQKMDAMQALRAHIDFDDSVFVRIEELKEGKSKASDSESLTMFDTYLRTVESVVDKVDAHVHAAGGL